MEQKEELIQSNIKLSIGILVSNQIQYIRKTMEGLKPLLDAVPSELIILDTVGENSDGSIAVAREYTDKIYPFTWCNDFAKARNACLERATGEWFLFQDDDEWFDDVTELIEFFKSGECEKYYCGYHYVRNYLADGSYATGIVARLIRRTNQTRFVGKIHEHFEKEYAPKKHFHCFIHHYGYAYATEEAKAKKRQRNLELLKAEIQEDGLNPQRAAQMAQELISGDASVEECYQYCMESIRELERMGELKNSNSQWLLVASVRCFASTKENVRMIKQAEYIRNNYSLNEMAELALACSVVFAGAAEDNADVVAEYCALYLKNWDWLQCHEEEALSQIILDLPNFLEEHFYYDVVHLAAVVANRVEDFQRAKQYLERLPWDKKGFEKEKYLQAFRWTMEGLKWQEQQRQEMQQWVKKQKEAEELIESLLEVGIYLKQAVFQGQTRELPEFLQGMQEAAIVAGTGLDQVLGENTKEVSLLEDFCELVWQCNNAETADEKYQLIQEMEQKITEVKLLLQKRKV